MDVLQINVLERKRHALFMKSCGYACILVFFFSLAFQLAYFFSFFYQKHAHTWNSRSRIANNVSMHLCIFFFIMNLTPIITNTIHHNHHIIRSMRYLHKKWIHLTVLLLLLFSRSSFQAPLKTLVIFFSLFFCAHHACLIRYMSTSS